MAVGQEELAPEAPAPGGGRRRRILGVVVVLAVLLLAASAFALWRAATLDSDGDGLTDRVETSGWQTRSGEVFRTDPDRADTDSDALTDREEAGALVAGANGEVYAGPSDPLVADTDRDRLDDGHEVEAGLDPRDADVDDDDLLDGVEVDVLSTDPRSADTDGDGLEDGYEDANRESQGLDPLVGDEQISTAAYVTSFVKGLLAGDVLPEDSLPWLAGSLTAGAATSIPVVGGLAGGATDLRDVVGSALHGDWVGAGFSAVGAVPGGDAVAIPAKAARFVAKNPQLAAKVARLIVRAPAVPNWVKARAARAVWPEWGTLLDAGADEKALLRLQDGATDLARLSQVMRLPGHVAGVAAPALPDGRSGERFLAGLLGSRASEQARFTTAGCGNACGSDLRIIDVLADGAAHESKVGRVSLNQDIRQEILKDAWLLRTGQIQSAHWDFFTSSASNTLGPDPGVVELLRQSGITHTIHLPRS